jgi:FkbM family methyltransferase
MTELLQICREGKEFQVVSGSNREFWESVSSGDWEAETFPIFDRFIDRQHSYIDMGSWIGPTLLYGCQLAGRAYGIEPDPIAYAELARNVACNGATSGNVKIFNVCIAPRSGKVAFGSRSQGGDSTSSLLFSQGETQWTVDGVTFEEFVRANTIDDCGFIKMDIEGGEYSVLPSMAAWIKKHRPTIYLSLHPCFLGDIEGAGIARRVRRTLLRLSKALAVVLCLRFYKNFYDSQGRRLSLLRLMRVCLHRTTFSMVATDADWHPTGGDGPSKGRSPVVG